ncbi:hypothetical protein [Polyangium mundeleinium]|uniref:Uncharacterized protein n=1 Tax=Polyangium mundeleinium TaxID=2995306 RepID=A0ABT5EGC7_9BACT|nr:hypothetical protein [Polyangium mundeleinium]MDC0740863.1 hypothetical protein [Polyangium mundeleinium]
MTQGERRTIGFDRPVQLEWLDALAYRLAAGASAKEAREVIWNLLDGVVAGETLQSARGKTLTVVSRIWLTVPPGVSPMRDAALLLIRHASVEERQAIHWALMSAAYTFFVDLASSIGKLIALNGEISLSQLTRRLVEVWGDRSTLRPAAQRVVRSMIRWGVLREGERPGQYLPPTKRIVVSAEVSELLLEGLLLAAGRGGMPLSQLLMHPAAFPFELRFDPTRLRKSARLRLHRQGDQADYVEREETRPASSARAIPKERPRAARRGG